MTVIELPRDLVDLLSPPACRDPYGYFGRYRDIAPVLYNEQWDGWIFTSHEDVRGALTDGTTTNDRMARFQGKLTERAGGDSDAEIVYDVMSKWIIYREPPGHTRIRRHMALPFMPGSVHKRSELIVAAIDGLLDRVEELGLDAPVDLLTEFAALVPAAVISKLMGLPNSDVPQIRNWSEEMALLVLGGFGVEDRHERARVAFAEIAAYMRDQFAYRRRNLGDDVLSHMLADPSSEPLSDDELVASAILLVFAGHETTMHLIANSLLSLHTHPDARRDLIEGDVEVSTAVEEFIRFDGPTRAVFRDIAVDHVRHGQLLKAGERALLILSAANHDPAAFDRPDDLILDRAPNRHLGFGAGVHVCLGAPLARMETQLAVPKFLRRFPNYLIVGDISWQRLMMTRGVTALPAVVRP